jgi:hypothetical protein
LFSNKYKVYWWSRIKEENGLVENFGDMITPYLVRKITGKAPLYFNVHGRFKNKFVHYLFVGSIIGRANKKSIVWGSGIIKTDQKIGNAKFIAVRGPRTAKRIEELGYKAPKIYGDPALLLSRLYLSKADKKYNFGLVSHYKDSEFISRLLMSHKDILHISLENEDVEEVIDLIATCDKIISTSLHGIIVAHSYGIPAVWWKFSDNLSGDDIKFYDYFESVKVFLRENHRTFSLEEIMSKGDFSVPSKEVLHTIQNDLMKSFPLKK